MELALLALVVVGIASAIPVSLKQKCNSGPDYWCQDLETATLCGVVELCRFEWEGEDHGKSNGPATGQKLDAAPVNVTLYYESLCPDCRMVMSSQIWPTYQRLASSNILNLQFVPYGNAREYQSGGRWLFYCQHGSAECLGNTIETCALHFMTEQSKYVPFIHCIEYYGPTEVNAKYCASLVQVDYEQISNCVHGSLGNQLQHEMALKTAALYPPHQYVPWFTLNGQHTSAIQQELSSDMLRYVCSAYTGTKPAACTETALEGCKKERE